MSDLKPWRDRVKPHPAADLFPMMSEPDLTELAEDIAGSGLRQGVVLWTPDRKSYGDGPPEENYLLDGRNRLQAVERAFSDPGERDARLRAALGETIKILGAPIERPRQLYADTDPFGFVVSANIHRRHLTGEQKRELIANLLKANPERSDRALAKLAQVSDKTVGTARAVLERRVEIPHVATRTDSRGRQQPAGKPEPALDPLDPMTRVRLAEAAEAEDEAKREARRTAEKTAQAAAVRKARPVTIMQVSALLRIDTNNTLEEIVRLLGHARRDIVALPKEKRVSVARGCLSALGLDGADLRPVG